MTDPEAKRQDTANGEERPDYASGVDFHVAESVDSVVAAWGLVYRAYYRAGLISPNPHKLHTYRHAASPRAAVFIGRLQELPICTITAYTDCPDKGLPMDSVYPDELKAMRQNGRRLLEIGLFADRRSQIGRQIGVLLELMRYACYYGIYSGGTDGIIGVHPHHAKFYTRILGFDVIGEEKSYDAVDGHPVVLLGLDWKRAMESDELPRGLQYFADRPISPQAFRDRVKLTEDVVARSAIGKYLHYIESRPDAEAA